MGIIYLRVVPTVHYDEIRFFSVGDCRKFAETFEFLDRGFNVVSISATDGTSEDFKCRLNIHRVNPKKGSLGKNDFQLFRFQFTGGRGGIKRHADSQQQAEGGQTKKRG
ncbi:MAG: hypothetical protein R2864_01950 [Syntrophotaleaceae bacterium]